MGGYVSAGYKVFELCFRMFRGVSGGWGLGPEFRDSETRAPLLEAVFCQRFAEFENVSLGSYVSIGGTPAP